MLFPTGLNTPKLALVITQYIEAYDKCHRGDLSAGPIRKNLGCGACGQVIVREFKALVGSPR